MSPEDHRYLSLPSDGYVFVVTYGRSGSTLTMKLLNALPGFTIRGENNNSLFHICKSIFSVESEQNFSVRRREHLLSDEKRNPFYRNLLGSPDDPWFGAELVNVDDYARALLNVFVESILRPAGAPRVLGFKDIHFHEAGDFFHIQMAYMQKYFPNARIIFQTRDLHEVARSGWWKDHDQSEVISRLSKADAMFAEYSANNEKCMLFDYSNYQSGIDGVRPILEFLEAEIAPAEIEAILSKKLTHLK